ncbi:MAG: YcxB family protein [Planctomycetes bacterium]|nr:YcxB family protein [Planctomycetota bacterium]
MNELEIEFEVTEEDLFAFNKLHHTRSPMQWVKRICMQLYYMLPIFLLLWLMNIYRSLVPTGRIKAALIAFVFLVFLYDWLHWRNAPKRAMQKMLRKGHGRLALGQHHLSINPEKICLKTLDGLEELKWHAIWKIIKTNEYAFIYNTPFSAFIIPKGAFDYPDAFESFVKQACDYHKQSQDYGLVCEKCGFDLRGVADPGCPECGWRREK